MHLLHEFFAMGGHAFLFLPLLGLGVDASLAVSSAANSATGATKFGNVGAVGSGVVGGSTGFTTKTVVMIVIAAIAAWWFLTKRGKS